MAEGQPLVSLTPERDSAARRQRRGSPEGISVEVEHRLGARGDAGLSRSYEPQGMSEGLGSDLVVEPPQALDALMERLLLGLWLLDPAGVPPATSTKSGCAVFVMP
jgi:hypothetical protein